MAGGPRKLNVFSDFEHVLTKTRVDGSSGGVCMECKGGVLYEPGSNDVYSFVFVCVCLSVYMSMGGALMLSERTLGSAEVLDASAAIAPEVGGLPDTMWTLPCVVMSLLQMSLCLQFTVHIITTAAATDSIIFIIRYFTSIMLAWLHSLSPCVTTSNALVLVAICLTIPPNIS